MGLRQVIERRRRRAAGEAIAADYVAWPQSADEVGWPDAATVAMIDDEPW